MVCGTWRERRRTDVFRRTYAVVEGYRPSPSQGDLLSRSVCVFGLAYRNTSPSVTPLNHSGDMCTGLSLSESRTPYYVSDMTFFSNKGTFFPSLKDRWHLIILSLIFKYFVFKSSLFYPLFFFHFSLLCSRSLWTPWTNNVLLFI